MSRRVARVLALVLVACAAATPSAGAQDSAVVQVAANRFDPFQTAVDPGGTITWVIQEGGHTIAADDGRFLLRGEGGTALPAGTTVSVTPGSADELVSYYCEIHGGPGLQGMSGRIRVGDPPPPPVAETPIIRVPDDAPSIADALTVARPGHRIEVAGGTYGLADPVEVTVDDVTIVGAGPSAAGVVLVPTPGQRGFPGVALRVTGSRVHIGNLTVRGFRTAGVHLDGAEAAALVDIDVDGGSFTLDGILAEDVTGATLRRTATANARRAGVRVADCAACGVRIDDAVSEDNLVGIHIDGAAGVVVARATVTHNAAGIIARSDAVSAPGRQVALSVRHSTIADNTNREMVGSARVEDRLLAVDAGVWLAGPVDSVLAGNDISGHGYGVVLSGGVASRTQVSGNHLGRNADADLAWDGLGANVCFAANTSAAAAVTSDPPAAETLYPCDRPTVGVPYPVVSVHLAHRALR